MTEIKSYQELIVWQKAMGLTQSLYHLTKDFPKEEIYGLVSQMRRAAVGIPSNIAEGWTRKNTKEYIQFLAIAGGSAAELETQLILSEKLGYIINKNTYQEVLKILLEVQKLLSSIINSLKLKGTSR